MKALWQAVKNDEGFTLVESIVAMSLFAIVVLGLLSSVSTLMFSSRNELLQEALLIAQNELQQAGSERSHYNEKKMTEKFSIDKNVFKKEHRTEIVITVSALKQPEKSLISLSRVILESQ